MSPFAIAALGLLALAALVGWSWWRKWHRELAAARHTYHAAQQDVEAATVFYGSMQLADERALHHELDWRERTMVELAPEALDPGPGNPPLAATGPERLCGPEQPHEKPAGTESAGSGHLAPTREDDQGRAVRVCASESRPAAGADLTGSLSSRPHQEDPGWLAHGQPGPASLAPVLERLADTGDIRDAALLADTTTYMRDQDADVQDWLAGRAITWARLEIGALT